MPLLDIFSLEQLPTIPYTQIQNVTADRILGRLTTSGSIQELTATQVRTLLNVSDGATNFVHPTYTARSIDTTGAQVVDVFTSDTSGSVTNITTRTMTLADLGYTGATNADNYSSWLLAASGTAGTATIGSGNTVTLSAGTGMTVTRATNTVTFATTITQYTDALARAAISLTTTGNSGAATYTTASGVLNIPNYTLAGLGGFANPMTTLGDIIYGGASGVATRLAGNTTTTRQFLAQTGTGTISAIPAWTTIAGSDVTGAALTSTNDTNVTVTLGGTPSTALLRAASLTLGWSGQLAVGRGGTGASTLTGVLIGNGTSAVTAVAGTASQLLRRNAGNTAYEFFTHNFETAFSKGDLVQGTAVTLSGTLTGRLVGTGNITVDHADTSTQASVSNTDGTVLQSATLDTYGHTTALTSLNGDNRWARLIEVLNNSSTWSHVSLQNGIDFTGYTTGSSGYPSTLGFAVAFYASTSDSTSGFGRAFALNREYNTENYYIGSPNTSGVHNGWRLLYHAGNLTISTLSGVPTSRTLTINGTAFDLSANRSWTLDLQSVTNAGNTTTASIGIGTTTLPAKLTVVSAADYQGTFGSDNTHQILIGASTPYAELQGIRQNLGYDKNIVMQRLGGNVLIATGTDSGDKLRVNGTVRFDSVTNATGDIVTIDANNVLRRRTVAETRSDLGSFLAKGVRTQSGTYFRTIDATNRNGLWQDAFSWLSSYYAVGRVINFETTGYAQSDLTTSKTLTIQLGISTTSDYNSNAYGSCTIQWGTTTALTNVYIRGTMTITSTTEIKLYLEASIWQGSLVLDRQISTATITDRNLSTTNFNMAVTGIMNNTGTSNTWNQQHTYLTVL